MQGNYENIILENTTIKMIIIPNSDTIDEGKLLKHLHHMPETNMHTNSVDHLKVILNMEEAVP